MTITFNDAASCSNAILIYSNKSIELLSSGKSQGRTSIDLFNRRHSFTLLVQCFIYQDDDNDSELSPPDG